MPNANSILGICMVCSLLMSPHVLAVDLDLQLIRTDNETEFPMTVTLDVKAELSASLPSEGLALIGFDLSGTLGDQPFDVTDATVTPGPNMAPFVTPNGITNPNGFGGTPLGGLLVQIGGGQRTIGGGGTVVLNFATAGSPQTVAHISIDLSEPACGNYQLRIENAFANVIVDGATLPAPLRTEAVGPIAFSLVHIPCLGDVIEDATVDGNDLAALLGGWGPHPGHPADLSCDGIVNANDLAKLLSNWGPCQ